MKDQSITIAKAFGIIMMVMAHCGVPYLTSFIYMFHMPLFFILSGYCFKETHLLDLRNFTWRRIKGLYFPFVKYGLLFLLLHNLFFYLNIYNNQYGWNGDVSHLYSWKECIYKAVLGTFLFTSSEQLLGGYWFLTQLFWASLFSWCLLKICKSPLVGIASSLVLCALFKYYDYTIPYTCISGLTFMSAAFFLTGFGLKKYRIKSTGWWGLACAALVYVGTFYWYSELPNCPISKMIPYFLTAVLGSLMTMQLSRCITQKKSFHINEYLYTLLIYVGNHTIEILTWHFLCFKLVTLFEIWIEARPIEMLAMFPVLESPDVNIWWMFYTIVGVGLPSLMVWAKNTTAECK